VLIYTKFATVSITSILAKTSYTDDLPQQQNINSLLHRSISILSRGAKHDLYRFEKELISAIQMQESLRLKDDPYRSPLQPPPVSQFERLASFVGYFLSLIVLLGLIGILSVLSGSAGKVLGDQTTAYFTNLAKNHPLWILITVVGLLAAGVALLNFFLVDRIKGRLKQWRSSG
jgi:hypothetical protein